MAGKRLVPKGCVVHSISLDKRGAEVRYRCGSEHGEREYHTVHRDGSTSISNYPSKYARGVRTIRLGSITVGGTASVHGFMSCTRSRGEISCKE